MTITLRPDQTAWLQMKVEAGAFVSIEDAARHVIDERMTESELDDFGDLAWAKPLVEEGLASIEEEGVLSLDEHKARNAARLAALKASWPESS